MKFLIERSSFCVTQSRFLLRLVLSCGTTIADEISQSVVDVNLWSSERSSSQTIIAMVGDRIHNLTITDWTPYHYEKCLVSWNLKITSERKSKKKTELLARILLISVSYQQPKVNKQLFSPLVLILRLILLDVSLQPLNVPLQLSFIFHQLTVVIIQGRQLFHLHFQRLVIHSHRVQFPKLHHNQLKLSA